MCLGSVCLLWVLITFAGELRLVDGLGGLFGWFYCLLLFTCWLRVLLFGVCIWVGYVGLLDVGFCYVYYGVCLTVVIWFVDLILVDLFVC